MSSSRAALPVRSPSPLAQLCTTSAPASTPASSVASAIPKSLCVYTSTGSPLVRRFTSLTRYFIAQRAEEQAAGQEEDLGHVPVPESDLPSDETPDRRGKWRESHVCTLGCQRPSAVHDQLVSRAAPK